MKVERTGRVTIFQRGSTDYLDYVANVQQLAWRTQDRYRAALERFPGFSAAADISFIDTAVPDRLALRFDSPQAFRRHVESIAASVAASRPAATEREKRCAVVEFCRAMGQIPEKRMH